jgi:hypothetical protein
MPPFTTLPGSPAPDPPNLSAASAPADRRTKTCAIVVTSRSRSPTRAKRPGMTGLHGIWVGSPNTSAITKTEASDWPDCGRPWLLLLVGGPAKRQYAAAFSSGDYAKVEPVGTDGGDRPRPWLRWRVRIHGRSHGLGQRVLQRGAAAGAAPLSFPTRASGLGTRLSHPFSRGPVGRRGRRRRSAVGLRR